MGQMDFISSFFVRIILTKISGKHFTNNMLPMYRMIVHSILLRKQWRLTQISVYIHVPLYHAVFINILGQAVLFLTRL